MPIEAGQITWDEPPQKVGEGPRGGVIITDPTVAAREGRAESAEERAERAERRADEAAARAARSDARAEVSADQGTEGQGKTATLLSRIRGGFSDILETTARSPQSQEPGVLESIRGGLSPVGFGGLVTRQLSDADRRIVHDSQVDVLDALLTLGTGAAYNQEQLEGQLTSYFPQYGDTPAEIEVKNRRLRRQIEAAKLQAGPLADDLEEAIAPYLGRPVAATGGTEMGGGQTLSEQGVKLKSELEQAWNAGASIDQLNEISQRYTGQPLSPEATQSLQGLTPGSPVRFEVPETQDTGAMGDAADSSTGAYFVGAANALTSGMMDELAPTLGMDAEQVQRAKEMLREKYPVASFAGEVSGQAMQMAGVTKALGAAGVAAPTAAGVAEIGGGALYGAGESNDNRLTGAALGAGAAVAGRKLGEILLNPQAKQAVADAAEKAGVPVDAMEEVVADAMAASSPAPLTEEAAQEIGEIARKAIGKGKPARDAKKQLAEMAKLNPEARAAAERLGVDLPLDIISDDAQLKTITGLARSQIGSEAGAAWRETLSRTSQQADQALERLGASPDIGQVGSDVMERMDGAMQSLKRQAKNLRTEVDDAIDVRARVEPENIRAELGSIIDDMGGGAEGRASLSAEEKKLLSIMDSNPTYARLNQLRDEIGRALYKGQGPWADTSQRNLARYYKALADDQLAHIESVGGADLAEKMKGSNTLFSQMYASRKEMQAIFGEKLEKDLAPLINRAVTKASKGDAQDLRKLLKNIPDDMRGSVLLSGLMAQSTSRSAQGGFSFAQYAKNYRGLRQNSPVYKEFAEAVGPQGAQVLTDLYAISRRMAEGEGRIVRTGASNQPLLNALNAESLVARAMGGTVKRGVAAAIGVGTGGLAGRSVAETIANSAESAVSGAGKSRLEKLHGLLSSDAFRDLVEKTGNGQDTKRALNRVVGSKEYNNFAAKVLGLSTPDQRRQWLQESITASSVIGTTRATEEQSPMQIRVVPQ